MKKGFKIILQILLALIGAVVVLIFLAFSAKSEIVPDIYVTAENGKVAIAIRGGYKWNSFSESVVADSIAPEDYVYDNNNVLLVTPGEKLTFQNSENPWNRYKFYPLEIKYYDTFGVETVVPNEENSKTFADLKYLEINAPEEEGSYVYNFRLSYYNKGEVSYGLKVVVSAEPNYEIADLIRYKNTSLKDIASIQAILNLLPYSNYKKGIVVRTNSELCELQIDYKSLAIEKEDLSNNTIALFTLIPELELITYQTENENWMYTRNEIERLVGRTLKDYANDIELWKSEILFKESIVDENVSRDEIYKAIVRDIFSEELLESSGDILVLDTQSFAENDLLELSDVDRKEILEYASDMAAVVYDMSHEEYDQIHSRDFLISLSSIERAVRLEVDTSGDTNLSISGEKQNWKEIVEEGKFICQMRVSNKGTTRFLEYEVQYMDEKWNIAEI